MNKIVIPPLKNEAEIKELIYMTLGTILQPLLDKWDQEIKRNNPDSAGLIAARADVQEIIDKGLARICEAKQFSDQMSCARCGMVWDVNDSHPPRCGKGI
jgi:hypothetical protein